MDAARDWRGAVIYQIYTRSFADSDGDGVGDLRGIEGKLDYLAGLGVDAIWIAPFFRSPMADFGYDVADYRAVDPSSGTLAGFDRLLAQAHARGLKVMIDQVLSHSSDQHAWFQESSGSRDNPKADWYVWADAKADGSPPNGWLSLFGGSAWQWEPRRGQYYLHHFLPSQPHLDFHHPHVQQAALDNVAFWLDRGVDGLRLDAINFCFHDRLLRDNPARPPDRRGGHGVPPGNPYGLQYHRHDHTQPENLAFLERLRALMDRYPGVAALGEVSAEGFPDTLVDYTRPGRLHMAYGFELLGDDGSAAHVRRTVEALQAGMTGGWPCWTLGNHDVPRVVTRWGRASTHPHLASQYQALACSLGGTACLYQGDELGLPEADLPFEARRDPYGIAFWPGFKGRDGCRTPMPWQPGPDAGFGSASPWLPVPDAHRALSVATQEADPGSTLQRLRRFLHWRHRQPALMAGDIQFLDVPGPVLAFERTHPEQRMRVVFNLSDEPRSVVLPGLENLRADPGHGLLAGQADDRQVYLPARGVYFAVAPTG